MKKKLRRKKLQNAGRKKKQGGRRLGSAPSAILHTNGDEKKIQD